MAAVYGAESVTDPQLLATAALIRAQWGDPSSKYFYPINGADATRGLGPMLGRYPGDVYDCDHPTRWRATTRGRSRPPTSPSSTTAWRRKFLSSRTVPADSLSDPFLAQVGITSATAPLAAATALRAAGDAMLGAVVYHSDHFQLSEQFDAYNRLPEERQQPLLSYAAFLSAVRARGTAIS